MVFGVGSWVFGGVDELKPTHIILLVGVSLLLCLQYLLLLLSPLKYPSFSSVQSLRVALFSFIKQLLLRSAVYIHQYESVSNKSILDELV